MTYFLRLIAISLWCTPLAYSAPKLIGRCEGTLTQIFSNIDLTTPNAELEPFFPQGQALKSISTFPDLSTIQSKLTRLEDGQVASNFNIVRSSPALDVAHAMQNLKDKLRQPEMPGFSYFPSAWGDSHENEFSATIDYLLDSPDVPFRRKVISPDGVEGSASSDIWYNRNVFLYKDSDEVFIGNFISTYLPQLSKETRIALHANLCEVNSEILKNYPLSGGAPKLQLIKLIASRGTQAIFIHRDERSELTALTGLISAGPEILVGRSSSSHLSIYLPEKKTWTLMLGTKARQKLEPLQLQSIETRFPYHRSAWVEEPRLSLGLFYGDESWTNP